MDNSKHSSLPRRLLAFCLALVLVISLFPAGTLQVRAAGSHQVSAVVNGGGKVQINGEDGPLTLEEGTPLAVTATADPGFEITAFSINGVAQTIPDPAAFTENYTVGEEDMLISVTFTAQTVKHTLTLHQTGNGTVLLNDSAVTSLQVEHEASVNVEATPAAGMELSAVRVEGTTVNEGYPISDPSHFTRSIQVTEDLDLYVVFKAPAPKFTVTVSKSGQGVVKLNDTETDSLQVTQGDDLKISVTPETGWYVSSLTIDGAAQTITDAEKEGLERTVSSVDHGFQIQVSFAKKSFNVKAAALSHGSIRFFINGNPTPNTNFNVEYGTKVEAVITPDNGYAVSSVLLNNAELSTYGASISQSGGNTTCTIPSVTANLELKVSLVEEQADWSDISFTPGYFTPPYQSNEAGQPSRLIYVYPNSINQVKFNGYYPGSISIEYRINGVNTSTLNQSTKLSSLHLDVWYPFMLFAIPVDVTLPADEVYFILDHTEPEIKLPENYDGACYQGDLNIPIDVKDPDWLVETDEEGKELDSHTNSGVTELSCRIEVSDAENFFSVESDTTSVLLSHDSLSAVKEDSANLELKAADYDGKYVRVTLTAKDRAGNVSVEKFVVSFNTTNPVLSVSFDTASHVMYNGGYYFDNGRTFTVKVVEKKNSFNKDGVTLNCTASLTDGTEVSNPIEQISAWTSVDSEDGHGTRVYTAQFSFKDAAYVLQSLSYKNKTRNTAPITLDMSDYAQINRVFTVDRGSPSGSITVAGLDKWSKTWSSVLSTLSFGLFGSQEIPVSISAEPKDTVSPIAKCHIYLSPETSPLDEAALEALTEDQWTAFYPEEGMELTTDQRFVAYLRIVDAAGHKAYISSDGVIVDNLEASIDLSPDAPNENGLYGQAGGDKINVDIHVKDNESLNAASGIRSVEYWIISAGVETARNTIYTYDREDPAYDELSMEQNLAVEIDKAANNACDTKLYVKVVDNAGNERITEPALNLDIDVMAPKLALKLEHSDNPGAESKFYNNVSAILEITERSHHFDETAALAGITITALDAQGNSVTDGWSFGAWETEEGETPDQTVHRIRISFTADANYSISAAYTDLAGNAGNSVSDSFTLDCTPPTGSITVSGKGSWSRLLETLSFGLWSKEKLAVSATAQDATSAVESVDYYLFAGDLALTRPDLESLAASEWKAFDLANGLELEPDQQVTVYLRLKDKAGNTAFLSSDGLVVETKLGQENITLTPEAPNANGVYGISSEPVNVALHVTDDEPYSGIKSVEYWITKDGSETARSTIYSYEYTRDPGDEANGGLLEIYEYGVLTKSEKGIYPEKQELTRQWDGQIQVDRAANNSCNVELHVLLTDNAGNTAERFVALDIDNTAPVVDIAYDNNNPHKVVEERGYFPAERTATITITERDHHFDAAKATGGIVITAVDAKGETVLDEAACKALISEWSYNKGATPDQDTHVATIRYQADANYSFQISFRDLADNDAYISTGVSAAPYAFTVDKTEPEASIEAVGLNSWDKLVETLSFGLFSAEKVDFQGSWDDVTSPIDTVSYYKTDRNEAMTRTELNSVTEWMPFSGISVSPNERATVYLRVVDYAGNVHYVSTDGIIVDDTAPQAETIAPRVTLSPAQPVNGIYNTDVPVRVVVEDPIMGATNSYSGLKEIRYEVLNMGTVTQSGVLFTYSGTAHSQSDLRQLWQSDSAFVVDKNLNNSNDVQLKVYAVDNAGNEGSGSAEMKIDVTAPAISVSYDNNNGDTTFADATTAAFFDAPRTATIVVTERNFDPAQVKLTLANTDGTLPVLSGWRTEGGSGNGDDTRHIATLSYTADGDYSFDVACTDQAGNQNSPVTYNGLAPQRFTIDRTAPVIAVSYEPGNAAAVNGNYFPNPRTATITITEHNFETSRVEITLSATDHGAAVTAPAVSQWTSSGNTHTATIVYSGDADYRFDIAYRDKAGNPAADYPGDSFVVDQTPPTLVLEGVEDASANSGKDSIGFTLRATDTNFDVFEPVITGSFYEDGQFVTKVMELGQLRDIPDGRELVVENLPDDGIYTVSCTLVDKAGNAFTEITLYNADGAYTVPASAGSELIRFSINRRGSTYAIDEGTAALLNSYYVQRVREDVVLIEVNTDEVSSQTVTLNGRTLTEGSDYTVATEGEEGQWHRYTYTVNKDLFAAEGEYNLVVSSKDKANNDTYSDVKGAEVKFVVDATAPVVTISGLETDGRYQTEQQLVTLIPTDDGGALRSLVVLLVDAEGETIRELVNLEGEDLEKALEEGEGKITFTLDEGLFQNVRIICDDWADYGPDENILYDETFTDVSVSANALKIFWANKPLRWGTMGGAGGIGILAILLALLKKKKKKAEVQ